MSSPLAPRFWGGHLLALVLVGIASTLGFWQLESWQLQREVESADLTRVEPGPLTDVMGPDDPFPAQRVGEPVVVSGTWVPGGTVFVSGREHEGEDGYWVVTPLAVAEQGGTAAPGAPALPVVRGWTPDPDAAPAAPTGDAELVAWLQPTEGTNVADEDRTDDVLPQVRTADLIQHVDQDLYGAYAVAVTSADQVADGDWPVGPDARNPGTDGLRPATLDQLPEVGVFTGLRNLLYALEWWVFAAFAAFIWWRWLRDARAAEEAAERALEDPVPSEA